MIASTGAGAQGGQAARQPVLLLDFDHTLYPPGLGTLQAVDDRINLYIRTFLGMAPAEADRLRTSLCDRYGTTLKGLELHHGVNRDHYCDFIHKVEEALLPQPDAALRKWLSRLSHPFYLFTNARRDWAVRGLQAMGLAGILPAEGGRPDRQDGEAHPLPRLQGIFDIAFTGWVGKPNPEAYAQVESHLHARHGEDIAIHLADDRLDNLQAAMARSWSAIWIAPDTAPDVAGKTGFHRVIPSLIHLDPQSLA